MAANAYHLLYPEPAVAAIFGHHQRRWLDVLRALRAITPEVLVGEGRVYGGSLDKTEPKELGNISADGTVAVLRQHPVTADEQQPLEGDVALAQTPLG